MAPHGSIHISRSHAAFSVQRGSILALPSILSGDLVPSEFQERLLQPGVQGRGESPGGGLLAAQGGVTPELGPQPAPLVPVHPDEETRVGGGRGAIGDPVRPVFRQPVILGRRGQTAVRDRQPHRHVRPAAGNVIAP